MAATQAPPGVAATGGSGLQSTNPVHFPPLSTNTTTAAQRAIGPEAERIRPASYAALLRPSSPRAAKKTLEDVGDEFKVAMIYNDKPGIFYTEEEVAEMAEPFRFALIGKFSGMRPKQEIIIQAFRNLGLAGFYNIRFLRSGYIFIHLTTSEDMARVWTRGMWYIGGVLLRIFKWTPNFSYTAESSVVPVWIQLPDLPIHMFSKRSLYSAAKIVGNPIKIDEATADCSRLSMARVCVEIDLLRPRIDEFWIGIGKEKRIQKVIYERVPHYCMKCLHLGHSEEDCYANGNKPKTQRQVGREDAPKGGDDLRDFLNRRYAAGKEKESNEEPLEEEVELLKENGGEKQAWVGKKGNSKVQAQEKSQGKHIGNNFQVLDTLEEEEQGGKEGTKGGAKEMEILVDEECAESRNELSRQGISKSKVAVEKEQVDGYSKENSDDVLVRDSVGDQENSTNEEDQIGKVNNEVQQVNQRIQEPLVVRQQQELANSEQEVIAMTTQKGTVPTASSKGGLGTGDGLMQCTLNREVVDSDQWGNTSRVGNQEDSEDSEEFPFSKTFVEEEEESEGEEFMPRQRSTSLARFPSTDRLFDFQTNRVPMKSSKSKEKNWNIKAPYGVMTRSKTNSLRTSSSSKC